jgi:hypothetical protein
MMRRTAIVATTLLFAALCGRADAGVVIDIYQDGSNVVATGSGSIDLTGLHSSFSGVDSPGVNPGLGVMVVGPPITSVDVYSGATGPSSFGGGSFTRASSGTGDLVAVEGALGSIVVPAGYSSGTVLSGSATFDNTTIAGLGLTPGSYTYTWGAGGPAQSLTVTVVPEPSSLVLAGAALLAGHRPWARRWRRFQG